MDLQCSHPEKDRTGSWGTQTSVKYDNAPLYGSDLIYDSGQFYISH